MGSKVQAVYDGLAGQKNELSLALKSGGSAGQDIIDKTTRIEGQAADVQGELAGVNNRIKGEKARKVALEGQIGKINSTVAQLEGEVGNLEGVLKSAEQDRADKDDQIKTLKDEIGHQADMISKLGKEKRNVGDGRQKTEEDIQAAEDKCNHLSKVKGKLEQALDESEDALEREKKVKGDVDKSKRKIEGDLKLTQEAVSDLERVKAELGGGVARKEKEGSALSAKIDDEATLASKYAKQAKELLARLEELDEELVIERGSRAKAEKSRTMLKKDIEDIASRLEEAGSNTATQVELNKKREAELGRIKAELEELNIAQEGTLAALRMKHNNSMGDLGEQIDSLNSSKVKSEKDKAGMELDLRDARLDLEDAVKGKAELDKTGKLLQVENQDLNRQIGELEATIANMNKGKISVTTQLEDTKALADAEKKDRSSLLTKYKMMATDLENLREKMENEAMRKSDSLKALSKAQAEIQLWKSRFETEGMGRVEELEAARNKLQAKIVESEELVDVLATKVANAEKSKTRMNNELDDLAMEYERVHAAALITEKRGKNFDKVLGEWQSKAGDVSAEVAASQDEGRNYTSELFRLKAAGDEGLEQLDIVKRENKNLADEIKDLLDQLGEGGRSIHDLDKQRRRLEQEKEELQAALEEAEATLEMEENKVLRAQLELAQVRQEIDRRVAEKEDEFNNTRKNHARAMDSLGASIETEQRAKGEGLRVKKQLEGEIKRYQGQIRETIQLFEDEARARAQISEQVGISERKAAALSGEVE